MLVHSRVASGLKSGLMTVMLLWDEVQEWSEHLLLCSFFQEVLSTIEPEHVEHMSQQNLSNVLLAAAVVQRRSFTPRFLNRALEKVLEDGNDQGLCNTLWALSALGLMKDSVFKPLIERLAMGMQLTIVHARQVLAVVPLSLYTFMCCILCEICSPSLHNRMFSFHCHCDCMHQRAYWTDYYDLTPFLKVMGLSQRCKASQIRSECLTCMMSGRNQAFLVNSLSVLISVCMNPLDV